MMQVLQEIPGFKDLPPEEQARIEKRLTGQILGSHPPVSHLVVTAGILLSWIAFTATIPGGMRAFYVNVGMQTLPALTLGVIQISPFLVPLFLITFLPLVVTIVIRLRRQRRPLSLPVVLEITTALIMIAALAIAGYSFLLPLETLGT